MSRGTTNSGYRNPNDQVVVRPTGLTGTDHNQYVYHLRCEKCGAEYGANGSDIHLRRCPRCDGGRPGLSLENSDIPVARPASEWALAEAKAKFSELIEKSAKGPLTITKSGRPVAVLVGIEEWKRTLSQKGRLSRFFQSAPAGLSDLDIVRLNDQSRDVDL